MKEKTLTLPEHEWEWLRNKMEEIRLDRNQPLRDFNKAINVLLAFQRHDDLEEEIRKDHEYQIQLVKNAEKISSGPQPAWTLVPQ